MKRILAAALSLALLCSLAACGSKDGFAEGKVKEGLCYQLTGISPDAAAMKVDGVEVPMDMYFYNLCYTASYMESYLNMYGMDLDWSMELQEGVTMLDTVKEGALSNAMGYAVIEAMAKENNVILSEEDIAAIEETRQSVIEEFGGEENYRAELAKVGLSEESYARMSRSDYLYDALEKLTETEGSSLYPTDEQLIARAAEQGYMTADHILLLTRDMSTYQELDEETVAQKKALAEELLQKIRNYDGDDLTAYFTELADEYSEDSGRTSSPGGYHIILRKPLDEEKVVSAMRESCFSDLLEERLDSAAVEMNPRVEALDVAGVYDAFVASVSADEDSAADGSAEGGSAVTDKEQENAEK